MPAPNEVTIACDLGRLTLRPEEGGDKAFRYELFCQSRPPEWYQVEFPPGMFEQLMQHQFAAQSGSYPLQFPNARFDIIELDGRPIGRIVVDRPGHEVHIVDQAITPEDRNRGIGTSIMRALMEEAAAAGVPVRLQVSSANDPSLKLYSRLGFKRVSDNLAYIDMEWRGG